MKYEIRANGLWFTNEEWENMEEMFGIKVGKLDEGWWRDLSLESMKPPTITEIESTLEERVNRPRYLNEVVTPSRTMSEQEAIAFLDRLDEQTV